MNSKPTNPPEPSPESPSYMADTDRKILLCSCEGSMALSPAGVRSGCKGREVVIVDQLCGAQIDQFRSVATKGQVTVACTYQQALFEDVAHDAGLGAALTFTNVRETAGWSSEGAAAAPKMAALLAMAEHTPPPTAAVTFESHGVTLIYGRDQRAIDAAERVKETLDITVILMPGSQVTPPRHAEYPIRQGRIRSIKGRLGLFEIAIDAYATPLPSSRNTLKFGSARDGALSKADLVLDLSGARPLFSAPELREGYLRADPDQSPDVARLIEKAASLVGTFDKPRAITFREDLCAHARSRIVGCTRCLDLCPAGAITPNGNHVVIDPHICAGCGQCAAACPTGAASYALPPVDALIGKLRAGLSAYHAAGGGHAQVLIHDTAHGDALIETAARFGDGLPARAIPVAVNEVTQIGLETIAAAFAYGAVSVQFLVRAKPRHDVAGLRQSLSTADTLLTALGYGSGLVATIETDDPDAMVAALRAAPVGAPVTKLASFLATGGKRDILKTALRELHRAAPSPIDSVALPKGSAFGGLDVRVAGCTLCLSCVSACPTRALGDSQDRPQLTFDESLCVQCGLCVATCPEKVISLAPRLNFAAFEAPPAVIKEEEPFCCVTCAKPFGVKSTIDRVIARLEGQNWMFSGANANRLDLIRMCEDCRVEAAINMNVDPFAGPARPPARTSDDYFKERDTKARAVEMQAKIDKGEA